MSGMGITRRHWLAAGGGALLTLGSDVAEAKAPAGYPRSYRDLEAAANREGRLLVYSTTDLNEVTGFLRMFRARYPKINLRYEHMTSKEVYDRFLRERARNQPSADVLWNSAMDLQIKLVNDGYAQAYSSPEKPFLPSWASWKNQAYGVTAEPIVIAYNKRLLPRSDVPKTHDDLERLLRTKTQALTGRVATYDIEASSTGFLFFTQDEQINYDTWNLLKAMGRTKPRFYVAGDEMLKLVSSGEVLIASLWTRRWRSFFRPTTPW